VDARDIEELADIWQEDVPEEPPQGPGPGPGFALPDWRAYLRSTWFTAGVLGLGAGLVATLPMGGGLSGILGLALGVLVTTGYGAQRERERWGRLAEVLRDAGDAARQGRSVPMDLQDLDEATALAVRDLIGRTIELVDQSQRTTHAIHEGLVAMAGEADSVGLEFENTTTEAQGGRKRMEEAKEYATEVGRSASDIAANAKQVKEAVAVASSTCRTGVLGVRNAVQGMDRIRSQVEDIAVRMESLEAATASIETVVKFIQDISRQTDLLALNAAIEAAGAGEAGDRFGVVAVEVKRLAERTTEATKSIKDLVAQILAETRDATEATLKGTGIAAEGEDLVRQVGDALQEMFQEVARTSKAASGIEEVAGEQVKLATSMTKALGDAAKAAVRLEMGSSQAWEVAGRLADRARGLAHETDLGEGPGR
jgi:methyl-accepting chemotaxis protein